MLPIEQLLNIIINVNIWDIVKILVLLALAVYIILALLIVKEVILMSKTVKIGFNLPLKIASFLHLIFSFAVFYLALIIL